jgi:hypothetical protein
MVLDQPAGRVARAIWADVNRNPHDLTESGERDRVLVIPRLDPASSSGR